MASTARRSLEEYLGLEYPFKALVDPDGGYVITFPDLPGCFTHTDDIEKVGLMAEDVRRLWIETAYEEGHDVPLPSRPEEYSGKFVVRIARSLHHALAESAEDEGVSLNNYVASLLARGDAQVRQERKRDATMSRAKAV